jgi:hypothetical protein
VVESTKPLLDKLGVKPGHRVNVARAPDSSFIQALRARGADVSERRRKGADHIFLFCETARDLERIGVLKADLARDGSLWVVRRKGKGAPVSEQASMRAGLDAGLVDVKVVSFSDTHTAEKFVFRLKDR